MLILLCALFLLFPIDAGAQEQPPVLEFPQPGLDDTDAYRGYATRFFRDSDSNTVQVVISRAVGRVVNLWADAADESISFTARDSSGAPAALAWESSGATVSSTGSRRTVAYTLSAESPAVNVGLFSLCSMRKERDFQYMQKHLLPFGSPPYLEREYAELLRNLERLPSEERTRDLSLLNAKAIDELRSRLRPAITASRNGGRWVVSVVQPTFDGRNMLSLELSGDTASSRVGVSADSIALRAFDTGPFSFTVRIGTDSPPLAPLARGRLFNAEFFRYFEAARARRDSLAFRAPLGTTVGERDRVEKRFELLERQVRSVELLSAREKLMAGLPNYATYFGRDMMMSAMMMQNILLPSVQERVIEAVLRKLSPEGKVSHEEALGGEAIRENAGVYNGLIAGYFRHSRAGETGAADSSLALARAVLADLQKVREDYKMVDETFQLPVLAERYLFAGGVPPSEKKSFLLRKLGGTSVLALLIRNLIYVERESAAFAAHPDATSFVSFPKIEAHRWLSGSWRDSGAGYANGRYGMDINVIWVPEALKAMKRILALLPGIGISAAVVDSLVPAVPGTPIERYQLDTSQLESVIEVWRGAAKFFRVHLTPSEVRARIKARITRLPEGERAYWQRILAESGVPPGGVTFLALSLDSAAHPIPVMNTDPATWLFLGGEADSEPEYMKPEDVLARVQTFTIPYPVGLFVDRLGPLVANDVFAAPEVWRNFERDLYHSPRVVWGREVNLFLLGVCKQIRAAQQGGGNDRGSGEYIARLRGALEMVRAAVEASGLKESELWSYRIANGKLEPARYPSSCDIQLWNLTDLAVQYELDRLHP